MRTVTTPREREAVGAATAGGGGEAQAGGGEEPVAAEPAGALRAGAGGNRAEFGHDATEPHVGVGEGERVEEE